MYVLTLEGNFNQILKAITIKFYHHILPPTVLSHAKAPIKTFLSQHSSTGNCMPAIKRSQLRFV